MAALCPAKSDKIIVPDSVLIKTSYVKKKKKKLPNHFVREAISINLLGMYMYIVIGWSHGQTLRLWDEVCVFADCWDTLLELPITILLRI